MNAGPTNKLLVPLLVLLLVALLMSALTNLVKLVESTRPPLLYVKDFNVEYVMARAVLNGESPYKPLPELAHFADGYTAQYLQHPSPHPPPVIFVGLPFTRFALGRAVFIWFLMELACVIASSALLLKALAGRVPALALVVLFFVWIAWHPFEREMFWGQLMIVTLTLISGAWLALRSGRDMLGGWLLGTALALKLFGWPIVLFLIIMRKWRAVFGAALCFAFLNLAAALTIGFRDVVAYYTVVGPAVSKLYCATAGNFSLWTIGPRAFDATASDWYTPLANLQSIALLVSSITAGVVLVLVLKATIHRHSFDTAFCALASISIVLNPITWSHYLVLTAPALCLVSWRMRQGRFPRRSLIPAAAVLILALLVEYTLPAVASLTYHAGAQLVPFWIGVIAYLPLAFVLLLTYVTLDSERWVHPQQRSTSVVN